MKTTLKQIRAARPCGLRLDEDGERIGYLKLKHYLGQGYGDDTPISLVTVLDSNGLGDARIALVALVVRALDLVGSRLVQPLHAALVGVGLHQASRLSCWLG